MPKYHPENEMVKTDEPSLFSIQTDQRILILQTKRLLTDLEGYQIDASLKQAIKKALQDELAERAEILHNLTQPSQSTTQEKTPNGPA